MAGTNFNKQTPSMGGVAPTYATPAAANSIRNSGRTMIHVKNGSGVSVNVTFVANAVIEGIAIPNKVVAVPAGAERMIGPVPANVYNFDDGTIEVDFSATATITMAAYDIP